MKASPRLLVIQHSAEEGLGSFSLALRELGGTATVIQSHRGEQVPSTVDDFHGLVLMGGPMGVYEKDRYSFLKDELGLLENAFAQNVPVLGVCLGSQLIAHALGGEVRPGRTKEIGWHEITLTEEGSADPVLGKLPKKFVAFHWHGDVFTLPAGATALAASELTPVQAFCYGQRVYGLLFHLEMTPAIASSMVRDFEEEVRQAGLSGKTILDGFSRYGETLALYGRRFFSGWLSLMEA